MDALAPVLEACPATVLPYLVAEAWALALLNESVPRYVEVFASSRSVPVCHARSRPPNWSATPRKKSAIRKVISMGAAKINPRRTNDFTLSQSANGSGRNWNFTTLLEVPLPVSLWNGARVAHVDHTPFPFHPALGSSILPSIPFAKNPVG